MTRYDCPECGRKQIVWWDARARAFLCGAHGCGFSALAPAGCACGDDREHVAKLLSRGQADVTPAWMAKQGRGVTMPEPMRLFEVFRAGDDKSFYVALPDDLDRPFAKSATMVEAALARRYGSKFGIRQLREIGDITEGGPLA